MLKQQSAPLQSSAVDVKTESLGDAAMSTSEEPFAVPQPTSSAHTTRQPLTRPQQSLKASSQTHRDSYHQNPYDSRDHRYASRGQDSRGYGGDDRDQYRDNGGDDRDYRDYRGDEYGDRDDYRGGSSDQQWDSRAGGLARAGASRPGSRFGATAGSTTASGARASRFGDRQQQDSYSSGGERPGSRFNSAGGVTNPFTGGGGDRYDSNGNGGNYGQSQQYYDDDDRNIQIYNDQQQNYGGRADDDYYYSGNISGSGGGGGEWGSYDSSQDVHARIQQAEGADTDIQQYYGNAGGVNSGAVAAVLSPSTTAMDQQQFVPNNSAIDDLLNNL